MDYLNYKEYTPIKHEMYARLKRNIEVLLLTNY